MLLSRSYAAWSRGPHSSGVSLRARGAEASRRERLRRRHKFRTDRILDGLRQDFVDLRHGAGIDVPTHHLVDRRKLVRPARAPERYPCLIAIERPAHGEMNYARSVTLLGEAIERTHRVEILLEAWQLEFWIAAAQVVAGK